MKRNTIKLITFTLILFFGVGIGIFLRQNKSTWTFISEQIIESYIKLDHTIKFDWDKEFEIKSTLDNNIQKAYFYNSKSNKSEPLIVRLYSWRGSYYQKDGISEIYKQKNLNYIHPDFRDLIGPKMLVVVN